MSPQAEHRAAEATAEALREMIGDHCDLCGASTELDIFCKAAWEASGLYICNPCLEAMLDASAHDPRAEVGLVGGGY
jgi:hypothetical protein